MADVAATGRSCPAWVAQLHNMACKIAFPLFQGTRAHAMPLQSFCCPTSCGRACCLRYYTASECPADITSCNKTYEHIWAHEKVCRKLPQHTQRQQQNPAPAPQDGQHLQLRVALAAETMTMDCTGLDWTQVRLHLVSLPGSAFHERLWATGNSAWLLMMCSMRRCSHDWIDDGSRHAGTHGHT